MSMHGLPRDDIVERTENLTEILTTRRATDISQVIMGPAETNLTIIERAALRRQITGAGRGVTNERVIEAVLRVPRHIFVPAYARADAYADGPLPIGFGQTISQPFIVAYMTAILDPQPTDRVLEIGAGCGYQTAVLAELARDVYSLEIVDTLAQQARTTLERLGYINAHVRHADGWAGWAEEAPYDAILVACSPASIPQTLVDQLKPGGRMILPVGQLYSGQELVVVEKTRNGIRRKPVLPVRFVPMTGNKENR